jgi:hypothetical protein
MSATTTTSKPSGSSFTERAIDVTMTLGTGTFGQTGKNTVKLSGLRVVATVHKGGPPSFDSAELRIYGLPPTIMNEVSTLGVPVMMTRRNNTILIEAGDVGGVMAAVFQGDIGKAFQNFDEQPETFFQVIAWTGAVPAMAPTPPISVEGGADVATMMSGIARGMGYAFENSGVQVKLSNPYFAGTALEQAHKLATAANIELYIDSGTFPPTVAIWPKTGTRNGTIPLISPQSGLIGYPKYRDQAIEFRCLLNTNLRIGGQVELRSSLGGAAIPAQGATQDQAQRAGPNGVWFVSQLSHNLSAQVPGGPWFSDVVGARSIQPTSSH